MRLGCVAGCLALLAACGGERGGGEGKSAGDTLAVTPEAAEAAPLESARKVLGPGVVHARTFKLDREKERFILALLDAADESRHPADSAAVGPGVYEAVLIEARPEGFAILKPGLYAGDGPALPADQVARLEVGLEDVTGDGYVEVWTATRSLGTRAPSIRLQAYERLTRHVYWMSASSVRAPGAVTGPGMDLPLDPASFRFSASAGTVPRVRDWLIRKTAAVAEGLKAVPPPASP
ncbi:MAG TPA: hypothetical protein VNP72_00835 [Longimicrobium sp.]|nr:hypothetical protein [Longimicrobium sp.]